MLQSDSFKNGDKNSSLTFPNYNIPESEKKEDYHKQFVEAITNYAINGSYDLGYSMMDESYNFYNGTQGGDEFNFLQEAEDGEVLPAIWINYNRIKPKIDLLIGEMDKKGYDIKVKAINKEAIIRKYDAKENMRIDIRMNPVARVIEENYNVPMGYNPNIPEDEAELDMFFDSWQSKAEVVVEYALKFLDKKYRWRYLRIALARDIYIAGRAFVKCEIINGIPTVRRVDPRNMIFDYNSTDDFLSDSTFFGEVRYMSIADAAQVYGLDQKEIKEVYNGYTKGAANPKSALLVNAANNSGLSYFKDEAGDLRVLVLEAVWQDYKKIKKKYSEDKYGYTHVKEVSDKTKDKENIKSKNVKTWRKGTLIGGKILKEWGEVENQVRSIDDFYDSDCPYKACIPNWINKNSISKVEILKSLQKLKNITLYNVQLAMARAGAKGFVYDIAQIPDGWTVKNVMKFLKVAGIAFIDSMKDGVPAQHNQFGPIDQTLTDAVSKYIAISDMIDREMDAVSGINEARQGLVQSASQAVGVTQSALIQSSLSTESLNSLFQIFASNVWTHLAGLFKFADIDKFAPIISETGINFFSEDLEHELDDYAVFIEEVNPMLSDLQQFQNFVTAGLQSGVIDFIDAIKLMREKDVTRGIREFERAYNKKQQEMAEMQKQAQEAESQKEAMLQERMLQNQLTSQNVANQGRANVEEIKGRNNINEALLEGRIGLRKEQIQGLIKKNIEKEKSKNVSKTPKK